MLQSLKLVGVGPAPEMEMRFAPRLNVLTGDNGLGKSLFLETIWYVLTGNWAGKLVTSTLITGKLNLSVLPPISPPTMTITVAMTPRCLAHLAANDSTLTSVFTSGSSVIDTSFDCHNL
jgi:hypothetical protein